MSNLQNYYQKEAIKLNQFENALKSDLLESEMLYQHRQEMIAEAKAEARKEAYEAERENETFNWDLN